MLLKLTAASKTGRLLQRSLFFTFLIVLAIALLHVLASWSFDVCSWSVDGLLSEWGMGPSLFTQAAVALCLLTGMQLCMPGAVVHDAIMKPGVIPVWLLRLESWVTAPVIRILQGGIVVLSIINALATMLDWNETNPDTKCGKVRPLELFWLCCIIWNQSGIDISLFAR